MQEKPDHELLTVSMLVSRPVEMFRRAIKSIMVSQLPEELLLFPSPDLEWDIREELDALPKDVSAKIVRQQPATISNLDRARTYYPRIEPDLLERKWKHTYDLVVRAILEASNEWVRMCDDDDEMFFDVRPFISQAEDTVAVINGDFYYCDFIRDSWQRRRGTERVNRSLGIQGSTNCFRKTAVAEASIYWEPGPWPDWQLAYHMHKLGWTNMYIPEVFSIQHWHGNNSSRARSGYIGWPELASNIDNWWNRMRRMSQEQQLPDYVSPLN